MACDIDSFKRFFHLMLAEGVYLAPSAYESGFMSLAHSHEDIGRTVDAAPAQFCQIITAAQGAQTAGRLARHPSAERRPGTGSRNPA